VASRESKKVVLIAVAANVGIAVSKYMAAAVSGSSSMMAEAFHSTADMGNELLLLWGMKRSQRPADDEHPFGHGKTLYFYSFLVAIYVFLIGGALAIHEGISAWNKPATESSGMWNYVVLGIALIFDAYSWTISYRELRSRRSPGETTWGEILSSKDPTVYTVLLEDSAGIAGTVIAGTGIFLAHRFHNPHFDAAGSLIIGVLLAVLAVFLGRESGALLVGEGANSRHIQRIKEIIRNDPAVEQVGDLLTMYLGPDQVLLNAEIKFRRGLDVQELESSIDRLEKAIREQEPNVARIFIEAEALKTDERRRAA
jgi:cation diffusion facilitator family transporter